jgi:FKBP-type peptidyl-prolyl cis-trans isomerase FkpA
MRKIIITILVTLIAIPAFAAEEQKKDDPNTFYAVGLGMARQLSVFKLTPDEFELVKQGLIDGVTGKTPRVDLDAYNKKIPELAIARRDIEGQKLAAGAAEFIEKAAKEKGAIKTKSGMIFLSQREGGGATPAATDKVSVNFRGTLIDGKEFESSYKRGQPSEIPLNSVIPCWTEGLQMMKTGGKAKLVCPPEIAYGAQGKGFIPANATLVFEIELLEIKK